MAPRLPLLVLVGAGRCVSSSWRLQVNGKVNRLQELETELAALPPLENLTPLAGCRRENRDVEPSPFCHGEWVKLDLVRTDLRYPAFIGAVARLSTGLGLVPGHSLCSSDGR